MKHNYHNTTGELFPQLSEYEAAAKSQDDLILAFFQRYPGLHFSSDDIWDLLLPACPRTSAVRALSNNKHDGKLYVAGKIKGSYDRPIYLWALERRKTPRIQLELIDS